jgi:RimJ/RimL family protein N-acetyltransferase
MPETIDIAGHDVRLERWDLRHLDSMMDAIGASLDELRVWMPWADPPPTREQERAAIEAASRAFSADEDYELAIVEVSTGAVIGGVRLQPMGASAGIGYWLRTDRVGRGIVTAASSALGDAAFANLTIASLEIHCDRANVRSAAIPRRLGYTLEGEVERDVVTVGHTGVGYVFRLLRPQ